MDYRTIAKVSAAGLDAQRMRLEAAALNLANMNATAPNGQVAYKPVRVVTEAVATDFAALLGADPGDTPAPTVAARTVVDEAAAQRVVHDPSHPHADPHGDVHYPGVNHMTEMLNVMSAMRAYEANVAALGAARSMATRALDIGGQS